jgi:hypothetical protein
VPNARLPNEASNNRRPLNSGAVKIVASFLTVAADRRRCLDVLLLHFDLISHSSWAMNVFISLDFQFPVWP